MKDWDLIAVILVYSLVLVITGMWMEKTYINSLMPTTLKNEFLRGAKMGVEFGVAQEKRDELQGVRCEPEKIPQ